MQQVHNDNVLIKWCKERGFMIAHKEGGPKVQETHLLLNGGRIALPDDAHEEFIKKMAEAIMREQAWLYVVEKKTDPGKFFLELDLLLWDRRLAGGDILNILMPPFSRVMRAAFPDQNVAAIVCVAPPIVTERVEETKQVQADDQDTETAAAAIREVTTVREKVKNGVHIIWPHIIVSPDTAWTLRAWLLSELTSRSEELAPLGELCEPWEKVIDPCVFGKNGLRMIWSRKASTCKICNGVPFQRWISEKRQRARGSRGPVSSKDTVKRPDVSPCRACNTFDNKVDEGRPYDVLAVMDCESPEAEMQKLSNPLVALQMTSIRVVPTAERPVIEVSKFAISEQMSRTIEPWRKKTIKEINQMRPVPSETRSMKRKKTDDKTSSSLVSVSPGDKAYAVLSEYVTSTLNCGVIAIKTDEFKHFYLVNTNSHECRNKGGPHSRSTIYLIFQPDGYYQKCWCRKGDTYRPGGVPCENYRSPLIPYVTGDISEIRQLFSARFAKQFPFTFGQQQAGQTIDQMMFPSSSSAAPQSDESSRGSSQDPFAPASGISTGPLLIDSYPELKGRKFSEVKKIIEERMKAWREVQATTRDKDEKKRTK